jgi:hypothetical protein
MEKRQLESVDNHCLIYFPKTMITGGVKFMKETETGKERV